MRIVKIRYESPKWFKPRVCKEYDVDADKARICRDLYGWGTANFYACLDSINAILASRDC